MTCDKKKKSKYLTLTDESAKNQLQEYCQKKKFPLPIYRLAKQINTHLGATFQAEVEVNGQRFIGKDRCGLKVIVEQSAANKACEALITNTDYLLREHLPSEYTDIEQFIAELVYSADGRIRKVRPIKNDGTYRFEITGSYKYCENVHQHHKANHIYFIVDPLKRTFCQKCYDPDCQGFRSRLRRITKGQTIAIPSMPDNIVDKCRCCHQQIAEHKKVICGQCAEICCSRCLSECYLCSGQIQCSKCRQSC